MNDIKELIREEIERRRHDYGKRMLQPDGMVARAKFDELTGLLAFIDSLPEEKPSEDLEEAAEKFSFISEGVDSSGEPYKDYDSGKLEGFIGGAEWKKEQMMKEAVEGVVMNFSSNTPRPQIDVFVDPHKYCSGDKVKIVIIKDND